MTDKKPPPAVENATVQRYRFRVRTADGRELVSHVATVRVPPPQRAAPPELSSSAAPLLRAEVPAPKPWMARRILVSVEGAQQGAFKPDNVSKALDGHQFESVEVELILGVSENGRRSHAPIRILRELGPSTPQFEQALAQNETLGTVTVVVYGDHGVGPEVGFFTLKLTNARVVSAELLMQNTRDPALMKYAVTQELKLAYQSIDWQYKDGPGGSESWSAA